MNITRQTSEREKVRKELVALAQREANRQPDPIVTGPCDLDAPDAPGCVVVVTADNTRRLPILTMRIIQKLPHRCREVDLGDLEEGAEVTDQEAVQTANEWLATDEGQAWIARA